MTDTLEARREALRRKMAQRGGQLSRMVLSGYQADGDDEYTSHQRPAVTVNGTKDPKSGKNKQENCRRSSDSPPAVDANPDADGEAARLAAAAAAVREPSSKVLGIPDPLAVPCPPMPEGSSLEKLFSELVTAQLQAFGVEMASDPAAAAALTATRPAPEGYYDTGDGLLDHTGAFVYERHPAGLLRCRLTRARQPGLGRARVEPHFFVHLDRGGRFVLSAARRVTASTFSYIVSVDERELDRESEHFHAKLRVAGHKQCVLYDNGLKPEEATRRQDVRRELAAIICGVDKDGKQKPRSTVVVLPRQGQQPPEPPGSPSIRTSSGAADKPLVASGSWAAGDVDKPKPGSPKGSRSTSDRRQKSPTGRKEPKVNEFRPGVKETGILAAFKANPADPRLHVLVSKQPSWCAATRSYELNFYGRVTCASKKNIQLIDPADPVKVVFQLGKVGADAFNMDFKTPLNATVAMGVALSQFEDWISF